ncbi:MAG: tetratricopeptide repeat protein [Firmicutes bacterium]|nr:tetratricopeptide repeat protein [Bacillota bacterium]
MKIFFSAALFLLCFTLITAGCSKPTQTPDNRSSATQGNNQESSSLLASDYIDDPFDLDAYEAEDLYNVTLSLNPQGSPSLQKKAIKFRNDGDFAACIKLLDEAIEKSPDMSSLYYSKGRTLLMMQRYLEAYDFFKKSIDKKPNAESYYFMGLINAYLKKYDESNRDLQEAMKLKPNVYALYSLGITCDDLEENENALEYYNRAIEMDNTLPALWYSKGIVLCQLSRYSDARDAFNQALKLGSPRAQKALDILKNKGF